MSTSQSRKRTCDCLEILFENEHLVNWAQSVSVQGLNGSLQNDHYTNVYVYFLVYHYYHKQQQQEHQFFSHFFLHLHVYTLCFSFFLKIKEGADKKNQLTVKNAEKKMLEGKEILSIFHQFDATSVKIKKSTWKVRGEIEKFCILGALNSTTFK